MNEDIVLTVRGRYSCGTTVWRCNGKTASCTGNDVDGVERCAEKAIVAIAKLMNNPEILRRPRATVEIATHLWTVTVKTKEVQDASA